MFKEIINIGGRQIGSGQPPYIIAEAGVAHFGDLNKGFKLIDLAHKSGADAVKFQAFDIDSLISPHDQEWRFRLSSKAVSKDFLHKLHKYSKDLGLTFLCTAHDLTSLEWIVEMDLPAFKIGSGECGNPSYIRKLAGFQKPLIISLGMYSRADFEILIDTLTCSRNENIALLYCVSSYPTPLDQMNLRTIELIRELFSGVIGYSDHTADATAACLAVALGSNIIEKHIALDFNIKSAQDWKVSCGPETFPNFVSLVKECYSALGEKKFSKKVCESEAQVWARKSIYALRDIPVGKVIEDSDIIFLRPYNGLSPGDAHKIIGTKSRFSYRKGDPLKL